MLISCTTVQTDSASSYSLTHTQSAIEKETPPTTTQSDHVTITSDRLISFKGKISFTQYQKVVDLYQSATIKPTHLAINSLGGDGLAGILLGKFIHQHQLTLLISDYCMSSCANFVFTASSNIILNKNALVVFHGSFHQENLVTKLTTWYETELAKKTYSDKQASNESSVNILTDKEKTLSLNYYPSYQAACAIIDEKQKKRTTPHKMATLCAQYLRQQESEYFQTVQVNPQIATWGQTGHYQKTYLSYQYIGFYYQLEDLKQLGIKNIRIRDNQRWSPYANPWYGKVYPVAL